MQEMTDRPWTSKRACCVLHQIALLAHRQGRSSDEFMTLVDYSPWELGDEFCTALNMEYDKLEHVVALVWNPTKHYG